jgi:hypothetical protein
MALDTDCCYAECRKKSFMLSVVALAENVFLANALAYSTGDIF